MINTLTRRNGPFAGNIVSTINVTSGVKTTAVALRHRVMLADLCVIKWQCSESFLPARTLFLKQLSTLCILLRHLLDEIRTHSNMFAILADETRDVQAIVNNYVYVLDV